MQRRGTTLMELLIYMAIVTVAILVFTNFMVDVSRASARGGAAIDVAQNARAAMSRMTEDIRTATDKPIVMSGVTVGLDGDELVLKLPGGATADYLLSSNHLLINGIQITADTVMVAGGDAVHPKLFHLDSLGSGLVTITMTITTTNGGTGAAQKNLKLVNTITPHVFNYQ